MQIQFEDDQNTENQTSPLKRACAILSFNHPEITARAVTSALEHHFADHIYLIHNGSEQKWIDQLQSKFPQIHHLIQNQNKGFTGGVNFAFKTLFQTKKYDWVFLLTNDCKLLSPLTEVPLAPGIYSPLIYRRKIGIVDSVAGLFEPALGKLTHLRSLDDFRAKKSLEIPSFYTSFVMNKKFVYVPGTAFWIHQKTFNDVGDFDESLHTYWEDVDYSVRAQNKKWPVEPFLKTEVLHAVGKTCHKNPYYTNYLFKKNRKTISLKYCNTWFEKLKLKFYLFRLP